MSPTITKIDLATITAFLHTALHTAFTTCGFGKRLSHHKFFPFPSVTTAPRRKRLGRRRLGGAKSRREGLAAPGKRVNYQWCRYRYRCRYFCCCCWYGNGNGNGNAMASGAGVKTAKHFSLRLYQELKEQNRFSESSVDVVVQGHDERGTSVIVEISRVHIVFV